MRKKLTHRLQASGEEKKNNMQCYTKLKQNCDQ